MDIKRFFAGILLLSVATISFGQSLYGSGISPYAALIRYVDFSGTASQIEIGATTFALATGELFTPYKQTSPGIFFLEDGKAGLEFFAKSGEYYTIIKRKGNYILFQDESHDNPVKAQIYLYNMLEQPATLKVTGGSDVIPDVKALEHQSIAVNPVEVSFSLVKGGSALEIGSLPLFRGGSVSLFLYEKSDQLTVNVVQAEIEK